ncbi:uncharacterized protein PHALS_12123 [Plasmopara halstedii]|uniref:Trichohyalin-plectin-homology domain-containing protein n=1 Tax=Plasmopara halstedii TaxID=4781 RepID=A0A0P1AM45_PLAHL|nr:uncharacterized protein PHALS_12123 [Plasmopara halstedii]CEG41800.1 hypothetical protein PHALS_12123 [Plasmopara halstedii]|eukprot:XP_024578169.1 hypothetical protein PHALS_12123 [Plasmopara halstedii]
MIETYESRSKSVNLQSLKSGHKVDRERLRGKACRMRMNEKLRLQMCARLQQKLHKTPRMAEEMVSEVLRIIKRQKLVASELTDAALSEIVDNLTLQRQTKNSLDARSTKRSLHHSQEQVDPPRPIKLRPIGELKSGRKSSTGKKCTDNNNFSSGNCGGSQGQTNAEDERYVTETQHQQKSVGFSLPVRVSPKKCREHGIWEEIVKFNSFEEQREAQLNKERKLRERLEFTAKLDDQVFRKHQSSKQERELSAEFHRQTLEKIRQADDEECKREHKRFERERQQIEIQTQQRIAKKAQQDRERAIKKAQEEHAAELLEKQRSYDVANEKARKETEKKRVAQVCQENEIQLQQKRLQQARERELEVKLAEEYISMEKKKDEARRKQIDAMAENVKKKMKIFDDTLKASTDAKAREEDARLQRYQQEYANKQLEDERKRRADADVRSRAQAEYLRVQMQEKKEREKAMKHDLNKQADLWKQERAEAEDRDNLVKKQRILKNRAQQSILRDQIHERELRFLKADQSQLEVQLNAQLLEKIHKEAGVAQGRAKDVVLMTKNRSRELQEQHR